MGLKVHEDHSIGALGDFDVGDVVCLWCVRSYGVFDQRRILSWGWVGLEDITIRECITEILELLGCDY